MYSVADLQSRINKMFERLKNLHVELKIIRKLYFIICQWTLLKSPVLTLPLGDHLETHPTTPTPEGVAAATNWGASRSAVAAVATAVEVLLPVAVPAVVLPTLEALLPLLPALLPPTVRDWNLLMMVPRFGYVRVFESPSVHVSVCSSVHVRMRLRFRLAHSIVKNIYD